MKPTARKKDRPESEVLNECLGALSAAFWPGVWWRQNAGKVQTAAGYYIDLGPEGIADIVGFLPGGQIVFVECKRRTGKQRESQKAFQAAVEAAGALYVLARSGPEAVAGVKAGLAAKGPLRPLAP